MTILTFGGTVRTEVRFSHIERIAAICRMCARQLRDYTGNDRNITLTLSDADYDVELNAYEIKTIKIDTERHLSAVVNLLEELEEESQESH